MSDLKSRDYLFDNIKGLLIFCVVYAHFLKATSFQLDSIGGAIYCTLFCFIMQAFLFVSGYFSKNVEKCRAKAAEAFLFPYIILTLVMYGARVLIFGPTHASLHFIKPSMALWYLLVLFVYRFILKDLVQIPYLLPLSFIASLASGFVPFLGEGLSLGRVFAFLPFFIMGYFCTPEHIQWVRNFPRWISALLLAVLPGAGFYIAYTGVGWYSILFKRSYAAQGLSPLQGLYERTVLIVIALIWIGIFVSLLPRSKTFLSDIGSATMTVFALHIIVRYVIKSTVIFGQQNFFCYFALFLMAAATTWLFSRPSVVTQYNTILSILYRGFLCVFKKQQHRIRILRKKLTI